MSFFTHSSKLTSNKNQLTNHIFPCQPINPLLGLEWATSSGMHYMLMRPHFTPTLTMNNIKLWYMVLQIFIHLGKLLSYLNFNFYGFFNILIMKDLIMKDIKGLGLLTQKKLWTPYFVTGLLEPQNLAIQNFKLLLGFKLAMCNLSKHMK